MEFLKRPIWRVPLVLCATGLLCRLITYLYSFVSVRIQMAQGPDPVTGAYSISSGHASVVLSTVAFLLFWAAGWKFVRGLTRKQIFLSATIMVVWLGVLLAWEQLSQAAGGYSMWVYRLYATQEAVSWVVQLLVRIFGSVSVPVVLPSILTPYCYLLLGRKEPAS